MLTIIGGATSRTVRAHWMASEVGLKNGIGYQAELIGSRTGATNTAEFRALNPKEKIPVLIDGNLVLTESVAIVTYLGEHYGRETGLVPEPYTTSRAKYNEWMSFIQMELDAHTLYVMRKHQDLANLYGEAPNAIQTAIEGFKKQIEVARTRLCESPYLLGETFTAVDLVMLSCLEWAQAYSIELSHDFDDYRQNIKSRSAYRQAAKLNFSISPDG